MNERLFDDLARTLATPMPRRRAIGLVAGALVSGSVLAPRAAHGRRSACGATGTVCTAEEYPGTSKPYTCCFESNPVCCHDVQGAWCCGKDQTCGKGAGPNCVSKPRCADGRPRCRNTCCERDERCAGGTCIRRCRNGSPRCGNTCCPDNHRCADPRAGRCTRCARGREACGRKCCPKGTYCCDDRKGLCCSKGQTCCNVGPFGGAEKWVCCPEECGDETFAKDAGFARSGARAVCCDSDRYVKKYRVCCPSGWKVLAKPTSGLAWCCPAEYECNGVCCSNPITTKGLPPELAQVCRNGRCVALLLTKGTR